MNLETIFVTLGLEPNITHSLESIDVAYKKECLRCHPDRGGTTEKFLNLNKARKSAEEYLKDKGYLFLLKPLQFSTNIPDPFTETSYQTQNVTDKTSKMNSNCRNLIPKIRIPKCKNVRFGDTQILNMEPEELYFQMYKTKPSSNNRDIEHPGENILEFKKVNRDSIWGKPEPDNPKTVNLPTQVPLPKQVPLPEPVSILKKDPGIPKPRPPKYDWSKNRKKDNQIPIISERFKTPRNHTPIEIKEVISVFFDWKLLWDDTYQMSGMISDVLIQECSRCDGTGKISGSCNYCSCSARRGKIGERVGFSRKDIHWGSVPIVRAMDLNGKTFEAKLVSNIPSDIRIDENWDILVTSPFYFPKRIIDTRYQTRGYVTIGNLITGIDKKILIPIPEPVDFAHPLNMRIPQEGILRPDGIRGDVVLMEIICNKN